MIERIKLKFCGLKTGNDTVDNSSIDSNISHVIDDVRGFVDYRRQADDVPVAFIDGDEGGSLAAVIGKAGEFYDKLRAWLTSVYATCMACYGVQSEDPKFVRFVATIEVTFNDQGGQLMFRVRITDPDSDTDQQYRFTFAAVDIQEEL